MAVGPSSVGQLFPLFLEATKAGDLNGSGEAEKVRNMHTKDASEHKKYMG